jgi:ABC-type uncharacterized transport system substrate-binding protein
MRRFHLMLPSPARIEFSGGTGRLVEVQRTLLREELNKLGWIDGQNVRFELRFSAGNSDRLRAYADDLVRATPDIITVSGSAATRILMQRTHAIPIVFTNVGDPIAGGLLNNIAISHSTKRNFRFLNPPK